MYLLFVIQFTYLFFVKQDDFGNFPFNANSKVKSQKSKESRHLTIFTFEF